LDNSFKAAAKPALFLLGVLLISLLAFTGLLAEPDSEQVAITGLRDENITTMFYDEIAFKKSIDYASQSVVSDQHIRGGIVPHHLLADRMIASFFQTISGEKPEIIIIIGPNHQGIGVKNVHTGPWNWQTPFGILETDKEIVGRLIEAKIADYSFTLLEEDHSISALIPYIKYYFPEAKVVALLVHGVYSLENSRQLGRDIYDLIKDENYLFLASVDFSHYLPPAVSDRMDEITLRALENRDLTMISRMNNDFLDSPPSIVSLLTVMEEAKIKNMAVLAHTNAASITGIDTSENTSYFTIVFYE